MATFSTNITSTSSATLPSFGALIKLVTKMIALRRQRRQLAELDIYQLNDMGITREEAIAESRRFGWDVPMHWRA